MTYCGVCRKVVPDDHRWCSVQPYEPKLCDMMNDRREEAMARLELMGHEGKRQPSEASKNQATVYYYDFETLRSPENGTLTDYLVILIDPENQV